MGRGAVQNDMRTGVELLQHGLGDRLELGHRLRLWGGFHHDRDAVGSRLLKTQHQVVVRSLAEN